MAGTKSTTGTKSKKMTKTENTTETTTVQLSAPEVVVPPPTQTQTQTQTQELATVETSATETPSTEESSTELLFKKLLSQFQDVQNVMKTLHSNLKVLEKEVMKERKESKKRESKQKKKGGAKKTASGFAQASPITPALADFLGLGHDQQIARTEVTSKVIAYVKAQNLQNPANKKQIVPDTKLSALLQSGNEVVTFFNLQTFLKKHFLPKTTATPSVTVV